MTEHRPSPKAKRWSKGRVRALAWVTGTATFLAGFGILGAATKPRPRTPPIDRQRRCRVSGSSSAR